MYFPGMAQYHHMTPVLTESPWLPDIFLAQFKVLVIILLPIKASMVWGQVIKKCPPNHFGCQDRAFSTSHRFQKCGWWWGLRRWLWNSLLLEVYRAPML